VNTPPRRSGMARVLKRSHSFTCTPRVHPLTEWTTPAFALEPCGNAQTHLLLIIGTVGSVYVQSFYLTSQSDILSYSYGPCRPSAGRDSLLVPTVKLVSVGDATLLSRMLTTVCMTMSSLYSHCHRSASCSRYFFSRNSFLTLFLTLVFLITWHTSGSWYDICYSDHYTNSWLNYTGLDDSIRFLSNTLSRRIAVNTDALTFNAGIGRLQVGHEVSLAGVSIDEVADGHVAGRSAGTLTVHVADHVRRASDVVIADDTAPESHATVRRRRNENHRAGTTAGVERLVQTKVSPWRRR